MPLIRCLPIASKQDQQTYDALVKYVIDNLTAPPAHVFLDLDLLVARTLSVIYGSSQSVRGALAGSLTSLDRASTNSAGTRGSDTFTNSGQFQCLAHDFQDCQVMTSEHLVRIVQRVIDMPAVFLRDAPARIAKYLDAAAIEWRKYVRPGNVLLEATAKQASSFDLRKQASSLSKLALPKAKSDVLVTNENMSVDQHPFVKSKSRKNAYCEKCFQEIGDEDPYECEVCNYFCHKNCRNTVNVGCSALGHRSASVDDDVDPTLPFSTRLRLLIDRYQSAQKEIEVATNIRDGIVRISKAKGDVKESKLFSSSKSKLGSRTPSSNLASVSSSMAGGLGAQLEQSDKKISILRREQTRNLTLIALMISSVPKGRFEHSQSPEFPADALMFARQQIKDLPESAPVKIMFREHHHRASAHTSTSMMINSGMDTKETIESIIDKYNESTANVMAPEDVRLCFEDIDGTERTLSPEDRPIVIWHMLKGDVTFIIAQRITPITLSRITNRTTTENISHTKIVDLRDKRLAILMEIIETEKNYVDNLTNAIRFFLLPISNSGLVPKPTAIGIFSNMQDLLKLHTKILEAMNHKLAQDSAVGGRFSELFNEHMDAFPTSYTTYCGNLNSSQRTLTKLRDSNVEFAKFIRECESRRQLSRLTLDDILIQPLHRITRYPILLKRLLSATPDTHPDFKPLTAVTDRLGKITATVNEIVKRKENEYRIRYVQQNLNWNDQCDEFPLASIGRKLIFEKPLQMQMVQSQGRQGGQQQGKKEWVDVLSMVFNDLVLFVTVIKKKDTEQFLLLRPPIPMENLVTMSYTSPQSLSSMPLDHPQPLFSGGASSSPESMSLPVTSKEDIHAFQVLHFSKHLYTFQTISNTDRLNWLCEVENLANMFRFDLHLRIIGRKIQSVVMTSPVTIGNASTVVQAAAKETSSIKEEDDSVGPLHSNPTSTSISASTSSGVLSSLLRMNFGSRRISGTSFASMQSHDSQYGSLSHLGPQALGQGGINAQGAGNAINRTSSITRASIQSAMSGNITITPNTGAATGPGEEKSSNDSLSYIRPHRPLSIQPPPRDSSTHHSDYSTGHEASTHSSSEHITHLNNSSMVATATVMQQVQSTASPAQNSTNASFYKTGISSADLQNSSIASGMSSLAMSMSMSGSFASRTSTGHFGNHNSSNAGSNRNSIVGGNISNNQTSASGASVSSNSAGGSGNQSNSGAMSSGSGKKPLISDFFSKRYSANSTPSSSSARIPTVTQSSQGNQKDESVSK